MYVLTINYVLATTAVSSSRATVMPRCYMVKKLGPKLMQHQSMMDLDECSSRSGTESPPPFTDPTSVKLYKPLESVTMSKHKGKVYILFSSVPPPVKIALVTAQREVAFTDPRSKPKCGRKRQGTDFERGK